jgi:hypothetical protein
VSQVRILPGALVFLQVKAVICGRHGCLERVRTESPPGEEDRE